MRYEVNPSVDRMAYDSFGPVLQWACRAVRPQRILEWGPGKSTALMLAECPDATVLSVEHQSEWADRARLQLGNEDRLTIRHVAYSQVANRSEGYASYPLRHAWNQGWRLPCYDLAFVDGRSRVDCLAVARLLVYPQGLVLLHDAEREIYTAGTLCYPHRHYVRRYDTMVMGLGAELVEKAGEAFA